MINKKMLLTWIACLILSPLMAHNQDSIVYPVVIQFQSFCCGVPDDKPLITFINTFKKKYKIEKITAWHIGPMGKEGEYWLAFSLKELNCKQAKQFKKQIKGVAAELKDKGGATFEENMKVITAELPGRSSVEQVTF